MGEVEFDNTNNTIIIRAHFILYGNAATVALAYKVAMDIENAWNEPLAEIEMNDLVFKVLFSMTGEYLPHITPLEVVSNTDPVKNFFRVEEFARGNISFVDGLNSNTGYFKLDNLLNQSSTAAHEFGHTLGLGHPHDLDIRGQGVPGIMYPRGTIVDPPYQYDPRAAPLAPGGTMDPSKRKVLQQDILDLKIDRLDFKNGKAVIGGFTSLWHDAHLENGSR